MLVPASPPGNTGVTAKPARMVDSIGNVLVGDAVGLNDNQFGPVAFVGLATLFAPDVVALSFCSQQYVSGSPFASVAEPVSAKGVLIGIVRLLTAETTGVALFAVMFVVTGQDLVARLAWIWAIEAS